LRPGLLQKYQNAVTDADKFALLKAFMVDPSMQDVVIESHYVDLAQTEQGSQWVEITLAELRKRYSSEAEKRFLQREVLDKQVGRVHPQDSTGQDEEMKLYWVWQQGTSTSKQKKQVGTKLAASGVVPDNKAARQAICDGLVQSEANFASKGGGKAMEANWGPHTPKASGGKGGKGGKGKAKAKGKVG
jgi:hypothetical protein